MFEDGRIWHSGAGAGGRTLIELVIVPVLDGLILGLAGLSFGEYVERSSARRGVFPGGAMAFHFNSMGSSKVEVR